MKDGIGGMKDEIGEVELRVAGGRDAASAAGMAAVIRELDPEASLRIDPATGIVHVKTRRDTLDIVAALTKAGFDATAMTG